MWIKAEMDKLTVEQQDVVARLELSVARQREQLLKEVRGDRPFVLKVLEAVFWIILGGGLLGLAFYAGLKGELYVCYAGFGLMIVNWWIYFHTVRAHQRLDALLKLLDFDRKIQNDSNNSKAEKVG